ncbi:MAG TPA: alpha/beta hydrolase [Egibacteraceae bacterium]|nr:alpha/beta hydrolase [Egibacteraceae bacterium]
MSVVASAVVRTAATVGDSRLSFLQAGKGPVVVALHGIPTGAELWRDLAGLLADAGYRVVAPDLPGYGQTRVPSSGDFSLAGAAATVARWLDEAALAPAWVVGHDAGGAVGQIMAAKHPGSVSRLTLTNSIVDGAWPAPRARFATLTARLGLYRPAARLRMVPNAFMRWQVRRAVAEPERVDDRALDRVVWDTKWTDRAGRAAFERHLAALTPRDTATIVPTLRRLRVPCQIVWGMKDPFQRWAKAGIRLRELLPSPAVHALEGCGHFTPLECPRELLDAMLGWQRRGGA